MWQTEYVDTKSQLADILTNGSFTLDEWNHLLRLLNIVNFPIFSCSHFFLSEQIAARTVCYVEERAGKYLQRKFGSGEAEIHDLGDGEAETYQFVSYNMLSAKKDSPQDMSDSDNPEHAKAEHGGVST